MSRRFPLTLRRLNALAGAVFAITADMEAEGYWPAGVTREDMEAAADWIADEISKREQTRAGKKEP